MSTYLLIHGSWHGAWCWYKIAPRLVAAGHTAIAIDMPGRGADRRAAAEAGPDKVRRLVYLAAFRAHARDRDEPGGARRRR